MIQIRNLELDVKLGDFHRVVGVDVGSDNVTILNNLGTEYLIPIRPVPHQSIETEGMFGDFKKASGGVEPISGIRLKKVTRVSVSKPSMGSDWDFHCRDLKIDMASGISLIWTLFCIGKATT